MPRHKTQDTRRKTSDLRHETSDLRLESSVFRLMSHVSCLMSLITRYSLLVTCLLFFACLSASGAEKYAGEFLNLGVGARPLGMGGSFVAISDDATAAYWNPAGLGGLDRTEVTLMHASIFGLDSYHFLNCVQPLGGVGTFGISWIRLGIDDIPMTTLQKSGNMSASNRPYIYSYMQDTENAFIFSYGKRLKAGIPVGDYQSGGTELQIGVNAKFLYNSVSGIKRNAIGFGGDVGAIWKIMTKTGNLSLGAVVQDFFKTRIFWNTTSSPSHTDIIQRNLKVGAAYSRQLPSIGSQITLSVDAGTRYGMQMHYGLEYTLGSILSLRAGVQERDFTAGAGLNVGFVRGNSALSFLVDYAFLSHELGNTHRVSLMTKF